MSGKSLKGSVESISNPARFNSLGDIKKSFTNPVGSIRDSAGAIKGSYKNALDPADFSGSAAKADAKKADALDASNYSSQAAATRAGMAPLSPTTMWRPSMATQPQTQQQPMDMSALMGGHSSPDMLRQMVTGGAPKYGQMAGQQYQQMAGLQPPMQPQGIQQNFNGAPQNIAPPNFNGGRQPVMQGGQMPQGGQDQLQQLIAHLQAGRMR